MYCRYCGKELPNDSNFCPNCGKKQKETKTSIPHGENKFVEIIKTHKHLAYCYSVWLVLHLCLFIFAKPKGIVNPNFYPHDEYDYSGDFYPFSRSLGDILNGKDFYVDILYVDCYDFSELFFYIVFFPIAVFGIVKCIPIISSLLKKIKECYNQWQECNSKRRERCQGNDLAHKTPQKEDSNQEPIPTNIVAEEFISNVQNEDEIAYSGTETKKPKMSLLPRLIGSIFDKILILIIFVAGYAVISPYASSEKIGKYIGLFYAKPEVYDYIDRAEMNKYGTFNGEIAEYFQYGVRSEMEPPHIGSTLELDKGITFSFIILNMVFYILFESILSASPGKRMFKGIILDSADDKIGFSKALTRGLCGGALMGGTYFLLHLAGGQTNIVVVIVFFLLLDLPVLFTKRSLLDLCSGTSYAKR